MKVLITGATGLVGKELVTQLRKKGMGVHYLTTSRAKIRDEGDVKGFFWDPAAAYIDPASFEGVKCIINLAGATISRRWTASYKKQIQQSRTDSLNTLKGGLNALDSHEVEYVLSASAIGIYPDSVTDLYTEQSEISGQGFLAETVQLWESAALEFETMGLPLGIMRIGLVLSKKGGALPEIVKPVRLGVGAPLGSGQQWQSWIHLEDLASMMIFSLEERLEGIYNAVAPNPVTNQKLTQEIARILGKPLWLPKVPSWVLSAVFGEMSNLLLASQRVSSEKIAMEGFKFTYHNVHQALENLLTP
ncbi:TIGR01777 family oxidoreductase [Robiginitalea aurantiaca]|uniref:TIGR01777 family oxidoreductase n=1 Tax=Robiginitalea aurantiaca TaxID=3056915 RepID=A0ABT7WD52_9FLAO|nr:TIGR01777 family oxidoreductase [Robiginitalea aurantiaca]MDM9630846.1 TIGR01777 family oxidoreductase [Robiginitalea aurantiaca]